MKIQELSVEEAIASLHSDRSGLTPSEALRRLREYGPNRIEEVGRRSVLRQLLGHFTHFFASLLWCAAGLSFLAEWFSPGGGMLTLGYAIVGVVFVNGIFSYWQEYRAQRAFEALRDLLPPQAKAVRNGEARQLLAEELVPGDVIVIEQGDRIPADCRLIEAFAVRVDHANLTGESVPEARDANPSHEEQLEHGGNIVLAGAALVAGEAKALVFATGMHTEFGKIAHLTQTGGVQLSPLQKEISRLSRIVAVLAIGLGSSFFAIGQHLGIPFWDNFVFAIGIIVANVPEGLLPTVTLALALAAQRMAKRKALIRHLPAAETLGSATVICTDKTGTLTQNRMSVVRLCLGAEHIEIAADTLKNDGTLIERHRPFFLTAGLCHNLTEIKGGHATRYLGDPMEIALVEMAKNNRLDTAPYVRLDALPFDSKRLRVSIIYDTPQGRTLYCKGAPETVLPLCAYVDADGEPRPYTPDLRAKTAALLNAMADAGLRVLAFAYRSLPGECDREGHERELVFTGLAALEDPPRPEVPAAIRQCRAAGIKVIMVTGDHPHTATAIAREIGLVRSPKVRVITGDRLRRLTNSQIQLALDVEEILFARVSPDQKLRIVNILKRKGHIVAVTGDGVNDAPALKAAHIGIAMGMTGTDVAREAADMVLLDDNFASIVSAIEEGRAVFENIRNFLTYILTSNVPEIVPYLAFALFKVPLALTIIQILAVDLGTDLVPALGLGADAPEQDVMRKPPRARSDTLINPGLLARAYLFLGIIEACAAMAVFFFVLHAGGWTYGQTLAPASTLYMQATAACLSTIIVTQVFNVFLCRSRRESVFRIGLGGNRLILYGVAIEVVLILLVDYTPVGNAILGTASISGQAWLIALGFGITMWTLEETRKAIVRRVPLSGNR